MLTPEKLSEICVKCGMCCDGTLFNRATIKNTEDERLAKSFGLTTFSDADGKLNFQLPCHLFKGCCTVYDQARPNICGSFFCEPLKKAQKDEITFEKAEKLIDATVKLRNEIIEIASTITEFKGYDIRQLYAELDPKPSEAMKKHGKLLIKMIAIRVAMSSFQKESKTSSIA